MQFYVCVYLNVSNMPTVNLNSEQSSYKNTDGHKILYKQGVLTSGY
jgi:hypothetical protein